MNEHITNESETKRPTREAAKKAAQRSKEQLDTMAVHLAESKAAESAKKVRLAKVKQVYAVKPLATGTRMFSLAPKEALILDDSELEDSVDSEAGPDSDASDRAVHGSQDDESESTVGDEREYQSDLSNQ